MKIESNVPLKDMTTFKVGGKARYFCRVNNLSEIREAVAFGRENKWPITFLGGGSNILVSDEGFPGLVIKIDILGVTFEDRPRGKVLVTAGAGENWDYLVDLAVRKNLWGLENLSGIPGTVGGAPVQNIGAYGVEVKDKISFVEVYDVASGAVKKLLPRACRFSYRDSIFKTAAGKKYIITKVGFTLDRKGKPKLVYRDLATRLGGKKKPPAISEVRDAVLQIRAKKFPDLVSVGTAGSFFKNPIISKSEYQKLAKKFPDLPFFAVDRTRVKLPLGWIIDRVCKLRGASRGRVSMFENQALVMVNRGGAKASEAAALAKEVERIVKDKTGLQIEWEVQRVGFGE